MATVEERRLAREWALREVGELIQFAQHSNVVTFSHRANQFADSKTRALVDKEIEEIKWQLHKRHQKLRLQLGI